jgi:hypothetical protein
MWKNKSKNYKKIDYTMNYKKSNIRKMNTHAFCLFYFPFFIFLPLYLFVLFHSSKPRGSCSQTIKQVHLSLPNRRRTHR